jgi:hypothetical protein
VHVPELVMRDRVISLIKAYSLSQSLFNCSSLEIVPSARHAARLERFAISGDVPSEAVTEITASSSFVKKTLSMRFAVHILAGSSQGRQFPRWSELFAACRDSIAAG